MPTGETFRLVDPSYLVPICWSDFFFSRTFNEQVRSQCSKWKRIDNSFFISLVLLALDLPLCCCWWMTTPSCHDRLISFPGRSLHVRLPLPEEKKTEASRGGEKSSTIKEKFRNWISYFSPFGSTSNGCNRLVTRANRFFFQLPRTRSPALKWSCRIVKIHLIGADVRPASARVIHSAHFCSIFKETLFRVPGPLKKKEENFPQKNDWKIL